MDQAAVKLMGCSSFYGIDQLDLNNPPLSSTSPHRKCSFYDNRPRELCGFLFSCSESTALLREDSDAEGLKFNQEFE